MLKTQQTEVQALEDMSVWLQKSNCTCNAPERKVRHFALFHRERTSERPVLAGIGSNCIKEATYFVSSLVGQRTATAPG